MKSGLVDNTPQPSNGQKARHHDAENGVINDNTNGSIRATNGGRDDDRPGAYVVNNRDAVCRWQSFDKYMYFTCLS